MGLLGVSEGGIQSAADVVDGGSFPSGDVMVSNCSVESSDFFLTESASDYEISVAAAGDTLLPYVMPQAEYMYGCSATAVGMLLGYYDLYGYTVDGIHYDSSDLIAGTISVDSRGSDGGTIYDMADSSVLCNFIASTEYVDRFYNVSPEYEKQYTFVNGDPASGIDTSLWNCLADYLGTGQYWRAGGDLATMNYTVSLGYIESSTFDYSVDGISISAKWRDMKYGLSLYVESVGYSLDRQKTCTYLLDNFTFEDFMAEIDAGRPVLISLQSSSGDGHMVTGYGYNKETREIIFDDTYRADCRMTWDGTYRYSGGDYVLKSFTTVVLLAPDTRPPAVETYKNRTFVSAADVMSGKVLSSSGDENYMKVKDGGSAVSTTIGSGGSMYIYSGGTADDTIISSAGKLYLSGGSANSTTVNASGYMYVYSGGTADNAIVNALGRMHLSGGSANSTTVNSSGYMYVYSGGTADNAIVNALGRMYLSGGSANRTTVNSSGDMYVYSGGSAENVDVSGGMVYVSSGAAADDVVVNNGGTVYVYSGAAADDVIVNNGGTVYVFRGAAADDVIVNNGGKVYVSSGGTLTGSLTLQDGAVVSAYSGGVIDMDISGAPDGALISDISLIKGLPSYRVTVAPEQTGSWLLAQGAAGFSKTISVKTSEIPLLFTLDVNQTVVCGSASYTLTLDDDELFISIAQSAVAVPEVLSVVADITEATWQNVTVTAQFSEDSVTEEYYLNGSWQTYTTGVTVSDNGTIWFRCIDKDGNISEIVNYTVNNIDHNIPAPGEEIKTFLSGTQITAAPQLSGTILQSGGSADSMMIYSTGIASDTVVNSGGQMNISGGKADGVTVNGSGRVDVFSGSVVNAAVTSGGKIYVSSGGSAENVHISSGGSFYVSSGATAENIQVYSGGVWGLYSGANVTGLTVVHGGDVNVSSGAVLSDVVVGSQSYLLVKSGASVTDLTVNYGGHVYIYDGTNLSDVTVEYGGVLYAGAETVFNTNITVRGEFRTNGHNVDMNNHTITLDLRERSSKEQYFNHFYDLSNFNLAVELSETQESGKYQLVYYGGDATDSITVKVGEDNFTTLKLNDTVTIGTLTLSMSLSDTKVLGTSHSLYLTVVNSGVETPAPEFPEYTFGTWTYSWEQALEYAQKYNVPIIRMNGDKITCGPTDSFTTQVLNTEKFAEFSKNVVLLYDTGNLGGFTPTIYCLSSNGSRLAEWSGYTPSATVDDYIRAYELSLNIGDHKGIFFLEGKIQIDVGSQNSGFTAENNGNIFVNSASLYNTTVNSGGCLTVNSGGLTVGVTVTSYGEVIVNSGGSAVGVIDFGGSMFVRSGGVANNTIISGIKHSDKTYNNGGIMYIYSGGIANSTTVNSLGFLYISSGGTASNTTVSSGGRVYAYSGGTVNSTVVNSSGGIYVSSGGVANSTTVDFGGVMFISSGGTATQIVENGGYVYVAEGVTVTFASNTVSDLALYTSMTVHSNTVANRISVNSSGRIFVYCGGTVNSTVVNSLGYMYVASGGVANSTTVNSKGHMYISSGGVADNTTVTSGGYIFVGSGGVANSTTVNPGGYMYISSGGSANIVFNPWSGTIYSSAGAVVNRLERDANIYYGGKASGVTGKYNEVSGLSVVSGSSAIVYSGGVADSTTVDFGGYMYIYSGGTATQIVENGGYVICATGANVTFASNTVSNLTLNSSACMTVHKNTVANGITVDTIGSMFIYSGGVVENTVVNSGGRLNISRGAVHRGALQITSGAVVSASSGGVIDFTVAERTAADGYLVNNLALIKGAPTYTITVSATQAFGTYKLAQGAADFAGTISIGDGTVNYGTLTVNGDDLLYKGIAYSLDLEDGELALTLALDTTPLILTVSGDLETWTNKDVVLTASFNKDGVIEYFDGSVWVSGNTITVSANGTYTFRATDVAGNVTEKSVEVGNIDKVAPKLTIVSDNTELYASSVALTADVEEAHPGSIEYSLDNRNWQKYTKPVAVTSNRIVYFRSTDLAGNTSYSSYNVTNIGGAPVAVYSSGAVFSKVVEISGATLEAGGNNSMYISSGGVANSTTVNSKGYMYVSSGGVANSTTVNSGGCMYVSSGGVANSTVVNSSGGICVYNGGTANDTVVNFRGYIRVDRGCVANDTVVNSGGSMNIFSGGVANGTIANSGGDIYVYSGVANSTTVNSGGGMYVYSSGVASNAVGNSGGYIFVGSGGTATNIIASSGAKIGLTVASNTYIQGNYAGSSFVMKDAFISGYTAHGYMFVREGTATSTTIDFGVVSVYSNGVVDDTVVNSGGSMYVFSGGVANSTTLNSGGRIFISSGGEASNTTVNTSGNMYIRSGGVANSTINSGGSMYISSGGVANSTTINSGGRIFISSGGTVDNTAVNSGGRLYISSGAVHRGALQITSGAVVSASSGGVIDFTVAERTAADGYLVNNLALIKGAPTYTITVSATQAFGIYKLAQGAADFAGTISIGDGTVNYGTLTVNGSELTVGETVYSLDNLNGNLTLTVGKPPVVSNLLGNANGVSWNGGSDAYTVAYSKDDFATSLQLNTTTKAVDTYGMPGGTYQWQVIVDNEEYKGNNIVSDNTATAEELVSDADGDMDVFFARSSDVWGIEYSAQHAGTCELVSLDGKNRIQDVFAGAADANLLVLTDDSNGDALFIDDMYSALGNQARLSQIDEIRAGGGNDIIDFTSNKYAFAGDKVTIYGGAGDDTIWAGSGSNTIFGDAGCDRIIGGSGNDFIIGGSGNDSLHGGGGSDTFCFGGNWGSDTVEQLAGGSVTLHFESGSLGNWNAATKVYSDGVNSVTVTGTSDITLKFGDDAALPNGAFLDAASENIFEDKNKGMIA